MFDIDLNVYLMLSFQADLKFVGQFLSKNIYFKYISINTFYSVSFARKQLAKSAFGVSPVLNFSAQAFNIFIAKQTLTTTIVPYPTATYIKRNYPLPENYRQKQTTLIPKPKYRQIPSESYKNNKTFSFFLNQLQFGFILHTIVLILTKFGTNQTKEATFTHQRLIELLQKNPKQNKTKKNPNKQTKKISLFP